MSVFGFRGVAYFFGAWRGAFRCVWRCASCRLWASLCADLNCWPLRVALRVTALTGILGRRPKLIAFACGVARHVAYRHPHAQVHTLNPSGAVRPSAFMFWLLLMALRVTSLTGFPLRGPYFGSGLCAFSHTCFGLSAQGRPQAIQAMLIIR